MLQKYIWGIKENQNNVRGVCTVTSVGKQTWQKNER